MLLTMNPLPETARQPHDVGGVISTATMGLGVSHVASGQPGLAADVPQLAQAMQGGGVGGTGATGIGTRIFRDIPATRPSARRYVSRLEAGRAVGRVSP